MRRARYWRTVIPTSIFCFSSSSCNCRRKGRANWATGTNATIQALGTYPQQSCIILKLIYNRREAHLLCRFTTYVGFGVENGLHLGGIAVRRGISKWTIRKDAFWGPALVVRGKGAFQAIRWLEGTSDKSQNDCKGLGASDDCGQPPGQSSIREALL
ncbi:hypothetical protein C8R47DRAFT_1138547 [Mycena vitilis]|nr:hypothetical protein C8R47DRAFT_1138547 [Mycena vitilis]